MGGSLAGAVQTGPNAPGPAPTLEAPPFFVPGETITWDASYAGVTGGRARLAVGTVGTEEGQRLLSVRAEAESVGVLALLKETKDTLSSWIAVDAGLPTRTEATSSGPGGKPLVIHVQRPGGQVAEVHIWSAKTGDDGVEKRLPLPAARTHDPISVLLSLRGWDAPVGARASAYSLGGTRLWKNTFVVEGKEEIAGPLGRRETVRIQGTSVRMTPALALDTTRPPRTFTLWVTADLQRIPIRLAAHTEHGDIVANVTSYAAPD